jgi:hypothetical protein
MEKVNNIEEYPYVQNFKKHPNKCFITVKRLGSFIVAENYDEFKDQWTKFITQDKLYPFRFQKQ